MLEITGGAVSSFLLYSGIWLLVGHNRREFLKKKGIFYPPLWLTAANIEEFRRNGVLVVKNVLSQEEVLDAREGLAATLYESCGYNKAQESTSVNLAKLSSTGGSGGVLDLFYYDWKFRVCEHPKVVGVIQDLWAATYGGEEGGVEEFRHPFGAFDPYHGYIYVDRVCYRLPERMNSKVVINNNNSSGGQSKAGRVSKKNKLQRSLTPHLDCCPQRLFESDKDIPKWRPIQAFLALTDSLDMNMGGFEACRGMHIGFEEWVEHRKPSPSPSQSSPSPSVSTSTDVRAGPPCRGQFTPIRPLEDADIIRRMEHIPVRAGDMCLWDFRIAHANARFNVGLEPREVIYIGCLPAVDMNRVYAEKQLMAFEKGTPPTDMWTESLKEVKCDYGFSALGRKLMAMDPWN